MFLKVKQHLKLRSGNSIGFPLFAEKAKATSSSHSEINPSIAFQFMITRRFTDETDNGALRHLKYYF